MPTQAERITRLETLIPLLAADVAWVRQRMEEYLETKNQQIGATKVVRYWVNILVGIGSAVATGFIMRFV